MVMKRLFAQLHRGMAFVVLAAVVLQFLLAGIGIFGAGSLDAHRLVGMTIALGGLLLALFALLAGAGARVVGGSALFFVLTIVQAALVWLGGVSPLIPALHPLNALVLLGLARALALGSLQAEIPAAAAQARPSEGSAGV